MVTIGDFGVTPTPVVKGSQGREAEAEVGRNLVCYTVPADSMNFLEKLKGFVALVEAHPGLLQGGINTASKKVRFSAMGEVFEYLVKQKQS